MMNGHEYYLAGDSDVEVQKSELSACLTRIFEFKRNNQKRPRLPNPLGISEDEACYSALPLLLSVFQSITLPRPRIDISSVNMLSCNGENPFRTNKSVRPKSSQGIILLSICCLTPTVSSLKGYRTKKIVS